MSNDTPSPGDGADDENDAGGDEAAVQAEGESDDGLPAEREERLDQREERLDQREEGLDKRADDLRERANELDEREDQLRERRVALDDRGEELDRREAEIEAEERELNERAAAIQEREAELSERAAELDRKEQTLETYVDDQMDDVSESLDETVRDAVSSAMANYSRGESASRIGTIGNVVLGLLGITLAVGGVANLIATDTGAFPALLGTNAGNVAISALLIFIGLAATLSAAANRV